MGDISKLKKAPGMPAIPCMTCTPAAVWSAGPEDRSRSKCVALYWCVLICAAVITTLLDVEDFVTYDFAVKGAELGGDDLQEVLEHVLLFVRLDSDEQENHLDAERYLPSRWSRPAGLPRYPDSASACC